MELQLLQSAQLMPFLHLLSFLSFLHVPTQTQAHSCLQVLPPSAVPSSSARSHAAVTGQSGAHDPAGLVLAIPACVVSICHPPKPLPRKALEERSHQWGAATACPAWGKKPTVPLSRGSGGDHPPCPAFGGWGGKGENTVCM